jgi:hypothetical protein
MKPRIFSSLCAATAASCAVAFPAQAARGSGMTVRPTITGQPYAVYDGQISSPHRKYHYAWDVIIDWGAKPSSPALKARFRPTTAALSRTTG